LTNPQLPNGGPGRSEDGDFVLTDLSLPNMPPISGGESSTNATNRLIFATAYADFSMENYDVKAAIDEKPKTGWSIAAFEPANRIDHEAVFIPKKPIDCSASGRLTLRLKQESDRRQHLLGRFRISVSTAPIEAHQNWAR